MTTMQRVRFNAASDVFEAFPQAADDVRTDPAGSDALAFLRQLQKSAPDEAIAFCAYLLPKREAVWWACQCVKSLVSPKGRDAEALGLAEAWVRDPEDGERRAALDFATASDASRPATWLAFAAGWSGGSLSPPGGPHAPPPPHLTGKAVRAGLALALAQVSGTERVKRARDCVEACIRFANGGEARL